TVVCGLPAVGKSHYVAEHKASDDLVWDWDAELASATGRDNCHNLNGTLQSLLARRDDFVRRARWSGKASWMIISRRDAVLTKLLEAAGASVVLLECDESV